MSEVRTASLTLSMPTLPSEAEQTALLFAAALGDGDLNAATACFTRDACLISPGATAIHGREGIRSLLGQMIARGSRIEVALSSALCAGEVSLVRQQWRVRSSGADGSPHAQDLSATLVLRRLEGEWKLAIAMPWG